MPPAVWSGAFVSWVLRRATLPHPVGCSTIAVPGLSFRVRNGTGRLTWAMAAANIDLKGFTEEFYWKVTGTHLADVLETIDYAVNEARTPEGEHVWVELTTLLIPGFNDDDAQLHAECTWIREHLGPDVPLHFSAFHPSYRMMDVPPTPHETLTRARDIALEEGLNYVYTGNVHDREGDTTYCPNPECRAKLVERDWYRIIANRLSAGYGGNGHCPVCRTAIAGRW